MTPDARFTQQPKSFWAHVRSISEEVGYTVRGQGTIRVPTLAEAVAALDELELTSTHLSSDGKAPTDLGSLLLSYFRYRADVLNDFVRIHLMDAAEARALFIKLKAEYDPPANILPMNKQKGKKKSHAYLTGIVNTLIRANADGIDCDYDPRALTTITANGQPLRTLARRVDGAFPAIVNPIAVWEIKEYYYTTTFGSRVADGVYESLLDGMELEELREHEKIDVKHYLIVDAEYTWWQCGRSYLCRIIDMLHMGYVDEVLFGKEVVQRLPVLARGWVQAARKRSQTREIAGAGSEPKPQGQVGSAGSKTK
jgi:hypothetical protein